MAKRTQKLLPPSEYQQLRDESGWFLRAWRHFRKLSQEELAAAVGTSKGAVSDFETGKGQRFNRDNLAEFARALGTTPGYLQDKNPFLTSPEWMEIAERSARLDPEDQKTVADLVRRLDRDGA